ncbi:MAG: helix-turn-helix domain-containing protein [Ruminococcaceae bacterium]|nr:helix-turn-helix domain-containing protein [Oscillospiraceae bacterium]
MKLLYQDNHGFRFEKDRRKLDFQPHLHGAVEVYYFLEGSSVVQCGTQKYALGAGDLFIAFPNQIHGYEQSKDVRGYIMILQVNTWLKPYYKLLTEKLPTVPYLNKGSFEHTGIPQLLEMAWQDKKTVSREVLQGYFSVIFGKILSLLPMQEASNDSIRDILLYIHEHYKTPISRKEIAHAAGYTESYLSHLFSATMRTALPDYINALRIEDAKDLLSGTDLTVSQITDSLGFGSIRNFNRNFLKFVGMSPRQYRLRK